MAVRRFRDHIAKHNWFAVGIDVLVVVLGVFIAMQVSNWNQARIEKRETERLLLELRPALQTFAYYFKTAKTYYATTRRYSDTAFAGWRRDPAVSDEQFVIAAYQASQIYTFGVNGENWTAIFGGERLRDIDNVDVRRGLRFLMTFDYDQIDQTIIATPYRQHVRQVIPEDIQDAIRAKCSDKPIAGRLASLYLPPACGLNLPESRFTAAAAALRAQPELVGELRWHRAAVATFLANLAILDDQTTQLQKAIDQSAK